ncbi:hypothetical protein QC334_34240 [Streptomyces sp. DH18]|uniref:hypothetical protein n=1 Tax=Streptomyces sp. DH18 TaxID=3040126 RepID=UPI002441BFFF|nr:hypothetical protein [Streptomyces sp. DH18]MDG9687730.1 hypothetical protein [Streptomyces sp. DH18]
MLTDIDVLSIDIDSRLRLSRSSMECKSGRGQSGEPNTIVWLAGFRQLLNLDRVTLVRQTVSPRGQNLARKLGIVAMDEATVSRREKAHAWLPERFAHLDGPACSAAESRTDTQLKGMPGIPPGLARFLRADSLLAESPELLRGVQAFGLAVEQQGVLPEPAASVLAGHSLIAVLLAALQDAGRLDDVPARLLRRRLESALTVGDPEDSYVLPMLERADALFRHIQERTHKAYVSAGAEPIRIDYPSLRDAVATPPAYLNDYLDLVERLRANPQVARDLLQVAELACFDALLGDSAWKAKSFAHLFTLEHKGLLLVGLRCLSRIAGDQVASVLRRLADLPFEARSGLVPDRSEPAGQETLFDPDGSPGGVDI